VFLLLLLLFCFVVVLFVGLVRAAGVWHAVTQCPFSAGLVLAIVDRNTISSSPVLAGQEDALFREGTGSPERP